MLIVVIYLIPAGRAAGSFRFLNLYHYTGITIMKREMYYGHKFRTKEDLLLAIEEYMTYYTTKCVQRKLNVMTPIEYHEMKRQHENCPVGIPDRKRVLLFQLSI